MPRLAIEDYGGYWYTLVGWRTGGSSFRSCPQDKRFLSENGDTPSPRRTHPCGVFPKKYSKIRSCPALFCMRELRHPSRAAEGGNPRNSRFRHDVTENLCQLYVLPSLQVWSTDGSVLVTERTAAFLFVFTQNSLFYDILFRKLFRALFLILMGCNRTSEEDYLGRKE